MTFGCGNPAIEQAIRNFEPSFIVQFTRGSRNDGEPSISSSKNVVYKARSKNQTNLQRTARNQYHRLQVRQVADSAHVFWLRSFHPFLFEPGQV